METKENVQNLRRFVEWNIDAIICEASEEIPQVHL